MTVCLRTAATDRATGAYPPAAAIAAIGAVALMLVPAACPAQSYRVKDLGALAASVHNAGAGLDDLGRTAGPASGPGPEVAKLLGMYANGVPVDLHVPSLFPLGTIAYGTNGSQDVVGRGLLAGDRSHAFLVSGGRMVDLGTLGGSQAAAYAINDLGQVAGSSETSAADQHAFLYANGTMTDLGVPAGAFASGARAINRSGQVVGDIYPASGPSHAALYSGGAWVDLGAMPGAAATQATAINSAGRIVGTAVFPAASHNPFRPGRHVGFIVRAGSLVDLNALVPGTGSVLTITDAAAISDSGQILCDAVNAAGDRHAVVLTPAEPGQAAESRPDSTWIASSINPH